MKTESFKKWILIVTGLLTGGVGLISVLPALFLDKLFNLAYLQDYDIIIRHWSASILLAGIFLIISAYKVTWRLPIVLYSILEKLYLVGICLFSLRYPYGRSFAVVIPLDMFMIILLVYVLVAELKKR
ncbi:hypothetical protein EZV73_15815 [Acidaminobacter sp. JC074]|uniref:hypothetical protein n=1 Tax=Acidaminobacter sp. JC074 TaxID=2530199 RepID=UPI001F0D1D86|nr:hypothetical protein [Acidaminobacter sp. JC074]MCH4889062.1 hypothetical protein [Acidaminobacter sp. JC074]